MMQDKNVLPVKIPRSVKMTDEEFALIAKAADAAKAKSRHLYMRHVLLAAAEKDANQ